MAKVLKKLSKCERRNQNSLKTMRRVTQGRNITATLIMILSLVTMNCEKRSEQIRQVVVINEMQPCAENNLFYKVIYSDVDMDLRSGRDSLLLITFADSIDTEKNNALFFPAEVTTRLKITVNGYLLNEQVGSDHNYGCPGSNLFRVTEVLKVEDVTAMADFPIDNK